MVPKESTHAAVPWYVGKQFNDVPPGHRYLLYLPFWESNWCAIKSSKQQALRDITAIPGHSKEMMAELAKRYAKLTQAHSRECIEAVSVSPFATGLGWEHPNENGFAFLHPYGLPYLAASGIKGVLRRAAMDLIDVGNTGAPPWSTDAFSALFGPEPEINDDSKQGALRFFDVIPDIAKHKMAVDIMNPHYGDYYQGKSSPHDAGQPKPIFFLVVPPGSQFTFVVDCPAEYRLPDELKKHWRVLIRNAFMHAFDWLGFGAKTAVGYGAFSIDARDRNHSGQVINKPARTTATATWTSAALSWNKGSQQLKAHIEGNEAFTRPGQGNALFAALPQQMRDGLLKSKRVIANVEVEFAGGKSWYIKMILTDQ